MKQETRWVVIKFGGTSVATLENWRKIADIVRQQLAECLKPVVVCSALSGVSDKLEKLLTETKAGNHKAIFNDIKRQHVELAQAMGLDGERLLATYFSQLSRLAQGAALVEEVSPRLHAKVLAHGELMSTLLGSFFLTEQGFTTSWLDAREILTAENGVQGNLSQRFLSANCCYAYDQHIRDRFDALSSDVIITQGFIANNSQGETVLLGRGGSDTSASYIAAKIKAVRCEIWTDVPGVYSANPRQVPSARLLKFLDYEEAQEITSMGAKVLHPRCLKPLREAHIPLHIRCTTHPDVEGTVIGEVVPQTGPQVKAISSKYKVYLISMDSLSMWRQVGYLADIFGCFKDQGLSVDLISSSETNVTVSLDNIANTLNQEVLDSLLESLRKYCSARQIGPCASISLVGRNIRTILHQLGPVFAVFEEAKIHLVAQAANDLNISFVVDENQAERIVDQLHQILFEHHRSDALLGPTWSDVFEGDKAEKVSSTPWWRERREELLGLVEKDSPLYVYNELTLREAVAELKKLQAVKRIFYSIKANPFPPILQLFEQEGLGFECVSPGEIDHVLQLFPEIDRQRVLFTPNFAPRDEYAYGFAKGVIVTLDNLYPLQAWPDLFRDREIFVRIDPGQGRGHHDFVKTAGSHSKFGIALNQIDQLVKLAKQTKVRIVGLHAHTGSGILTAGNWRETAGTLATLSEKLKYVRILDLGGGLGVVEKPGQIALDLSSVDKNLIEAKTAFPDLDLWLEPGRFLVAHAGVLLAKVTQIKQKGDYYYVGVNAGMNSLIRPALYGAWHEIVNLSGTYDTQRIKANIVGPICESGDVLGHERNIAPAKDGDVMLIATVGAYGHSMSSHYNLRMPAREVFMSKK